MEIMTIHEYSYYQANMRNKIIILMGGTGGRERWNYKSIPCRAALTTQPQLLRNRMHFVSSLHHPHAGLCGMDVRLGGNNAPTVLEAAGSFLVVDSTFTFSDCYKYLLTAYVALFSLGATFRILAFLLLRFWKKS